jgi:hypothetical protein
MPATCEYCETTMRQGGGCVPHSYSASSDGSGAVAALPYDGEWTGPICHDCGAAKGNLHHPGCDVERCPVCGLQAIGCDHTEYICFPMEVTA